MTARAIRLSRSCAIASALVLVACSSDPPEGRFACTSGDQCPSGWVCECNLCFSTVGGGGGCVDAGSGDAGAADAGPVDAGLVDAGPATDAGCGDCDDGVDCTVDSCSAGCENTPDDARCVVPDCATGRCDQVAGCVVEVDDALCPEDGNPCTAERCDPMAGCLSEPLEDMTPCDDGMFCNGPDFCLGGSCAGHPGDPCPGLSACDEPGDTCTGCATDADCPDDDVGAWSACDFGADPCPTVGRSRTRTVTTWSCEGGGMCMGTPSTETSPCTRPGTDGVACAADTNPCTSDICMGGACTHPARPLNTICGTRPDKWRCCDGTCINLYVTDNHCGACFVRCRSGTDCRQVDTGSGVPGGACSACDDEADCPDTGGTWVCEPRSPGGVNRCECRDAAACRNYSGSTARCGTRFVRTCDPN